MKWLEIQNGCPGQFFFFKSHWLTLFSDCIKLFFFMSFQELWPWGVQNKCWNLLDQIQIQEAFGVYHHCSYEFESCSWPDVHNITLWSRLSVNCFSTIAFFRYSRFPPPIKLTTILWPNYCWEWHLAPNPFSDL